MAPPCAAVKLRRFFLTTAISFLVASSLLFADSHFLGVAPEDEPYYAAGEAIPCRDGSKSFSRDRLNDGFCDCADGTDEPGTSACPESIFYCRNSGDSPKFLFSSRVNDHICDCCDGSDEYDGLVRCLNSCNNNNNILLNSSDGYDSKEVHLNDLKQRKEVSQDLEDQELLQNMKGVKLIVILQLCISFCMLTFYLFYRRFRSWRQQYSGRC